MDSAAPAPPPSLGNLGRTFAKILRLRRNSAAEAAAGGPGPAPHHRQGGGDGVKLNKLKLSGNLEGFPSLLTRQPVAVADVDDEKRVDGEREAMEALLANLFAGVSAVKASYAQLQVAQSPYDPETIQSADLSVVSELKRLSELKQSFLKRQLPDPQQATLTAQIQEQRNLIKTYKITTRKLETELQSKDAELAPLRAQLHESEQQNRSLASKLHPDHNLHLSGLNPTHFLSFLRYTVKSVRSLVKLMVEKMELAGWDASAAADAVHPGLLRSVRHRGFAFESFVTQMMFSDFHHRNFSLGSLEEMNGWDRRRFFQEFSAAKAAEEISATSPAGKFLRVKYLMLVHPKMEAAFAGDLEERALVSSGRGFPDSRFFAEFKEMARRVWMLHCLFFSFDKGEEASVFQARRGCRFSEVYMESVVEDASAEAAGARRTVGFTVVPGFRVGRTVIQCKVYL